MIDDEKIEEATRKYINKNDYFAKYDEEPCTDIEFAYKDGYAEGYKDAINDFLKDLWHPASEVPEIGRVIIMENYYPDGRIMFISRMRKSTFHNPIDIGNTKKWFYIEDLLSKKGDKQ